jgi:hypothetical protein
MGTERHLILIPGRKVLAPDPLPSVWSAMTCNGQEKRLPGVAQDPLARKLKTRWRLAMVHGFPCFSQGSRPKKRGTSPLFRVKPWQRD